MLRMEHVVPNMGKFAMSRLGIAMRLLKMKEAWRTKKLRKLELGGTKRDEQHVGQIGNGIGEAKQSLIRNGWTILSQNRRTISTRRKTLSGGKSV